MAGNAEIDLPASPYRLLNALDEIGIKSTKEIVYQEILNYGSFGYLEPHFDEYTMLEELNTLAQKLAVFDRVDSMRQFVCECLNCGLKKTRQFKEEPYPEYGEVFVAHCKVCDSDQNHTRVLTRKTQAELRRRQEEEDLKKSISDQCARHGFTCRFLYQSVIITTPLADWCFDYHEKYKTLYHENTPNTKYLTGHYVKAHTQFKGKKMTVSAVIEYIASHEGWRAEQRSKTTKEKSE